MFQIAIIVIFVFTDIMTQVNTDAWQGAFMIVTLFTVVIFNIMVAFLQVLKMDVKKRISLTIF